MKVSTRQSTLAKACLGIMTLLPASAPALINPSLQAKDLFERFQHVLVTKVSKVDENTGHLELTVISQPKGKLSSETVTMTFPPPEEDADFESEESSFEVPEIGQIVVAFAASKVRRREKDVMIYVGDRQWHEVELDPANPSSWEWTEAGEESLVGTFNGQAERLAEAVTDLADGSYFFPARVWARFQDDLVVAKSEQPFAGVAIHDLDRDGRPDIVATSGTGVRLMRQTGELKF
ncbi:MAG: VCBS repeat-containing protein, partial [Akkermansiaceae bacterium]|nr:VCBS repeat-containing protein [Akkermansiaceae bacterium]